MASAYRIDTNDSSLDRVVAELCARIGRIEAELGTLSIGELCHRVDAMRSIASREQMLAVAEIASNLSDALARDRHAALIRPYLSAMLEACGCARGDRHPVHALLASISVRLAD